MTHSIALKSTGVAPNWASAELISMTIEVWQPYYAHPLTEQDAIEILMNVAALFDALGDADVEAVSSPCESL